MVKKWYRLDGANEFSVLWASLFLLSLHNVTTAISLGEHGHKFHFAFCLCASVIIRYPESLSHASFLENTSLYGPVYCLIWPHLPLSPTSEILPLCPLKSRFILSKKGKKNNPKLTSHHLFFFYFFYLFASNDTWLSPEIAVLRAALIKPNMTEDDYLSCSSFPQAKPTPSFLLWNTSYLILLPVLHFFFHLFKEFVIIHPSFL